MTDIKTIVIDGIDAGAREAAANLFKVANSGDKDCETRAQHGLVQIEVTRNMLLDLVDEVFADKA